MTTNYRVTITDDQAELWETWGNYRLTFQRIASGWKMAGFRYYAKYNRGNEYVRTHTR
jgi:hypothetical protein